MCSIDVKLKLFEAHCSPMYCAQLWWDFRRATMKRFVVSYHNILKRVIGLSKYESTSATCTFFRVQSCNSVMRNLMYTFLKRVDFSDNKIVHAICTSDMYFRSRIRRSMLRRLHLDMTFDAGITWTLIKLLCYGLSVVYLDALFMNLAWMLLCVPLSP